MFNTSYRLADSKTRCRFPVWLGWESQFSQVYSSSARFVANPIKELRRDWLGFACLFVCCRQRHVVAVPPPIRFGFHLHFSLFLLTVFALPLQFQLFFAISECYFPVGLNWRFSCSSIYRQFRLAICKYIIVMNELDLGFMTKQFQI
jgi:hypothetical protein